MLIIDLDFKFCCQLTAICYELIHVNYIFKDLNLPRQLAIEYILSKELIKVCILCM